jgi:hypothetical protein
VNFLHRMVSSAGVAEVLVVTVCHIEVVAVAIASAELLAQVSIAVSHNSIMFVCADPNKSSEPRNLHGWVNRR